jgi:glycosyltransferase involved in cell wall biosynthesis
MLPIKTHEIGVIYWGFRGGGKDLTEQLIKTAINENVKISWSTRAFISNPPSLQAPKSLYSVFNWIRLRNQIGKTFKDLEIKLVIIPMTSPWDLFIGQKLMSHGIKVIRIIHDAEPHPGDFWPTKSWITRVCLDADRLVFLSNFVANSMLSNINLNPREIVIRHLPVPLDSRKTEHSMRSMGFREKTPRRKVLFLGRGKKYKGLKLLEESWLLIDNPAWSLTILGEGHKVRKELPRTTHISGWASNEMMVEEILAHDLIVLPYIEASQSGIIPLCHSLGKPVLVTPVGGLPEQIKDGENGLVSPSLSPLDLAKYIEKGLGMNWPIQNFKSGDTERDFLMEIIF